MVTIVPGVVSKQTIRFLGPEASAADAAAMMTEHGIGAVVVLDGSQRLVGIVTERDLVRRVIARSESPESARLSAIMTGNPETVAPGDLAMEALEKMRIDGYRHLPVVENGAVVGMLSMRDLRHSIARELKAAPSPHPIARALRRLVGTG